MEKFEVSIFMLTYNQEDFISQAIEGVLMQKTNFRYQLVIGEDCSTDDTRKICQVYAQKYPDKIRLILNQRNLGIGANYVKTYKECTGKYVAICDGDDFWVDPEKLQKQVDFLEKNKEYKIVYTNNVNLLPSGKKVDPKKHESPQSTSFDDLVLKNYIPSVTALFLKKNLTRNMEEWIPHFPYADWPTYLLILSDGGKVYCLNEQTAVYRKDFGTSTSLRRVKSKMGEINLAILKNLKKEEGFALRKKSIKSAIEKYTCGLMSSYNKERNFHKSFTMLITLLLQRIRFYYIRVYLYSLKQSIILFFMDRKQPEEYRVKI